MYAIYDLLDSLRYQYPNGVTTMAHCSAGCGKPARGGRKCKDCLGDDLERLGVDKALVSQLQLKHKELQAQQSEIEDIKDEIIKDEIIKGVKTNGHN